VIHQRQLVVQRQHQWTLSRRFLCQSAHSCSCERLLLAARLMCTRHEMLVLRSSGGLRMSPALMSPRSSWHSVCIVIMASIAQCRHSQTLRIRSQSCQRQSKLPRLPTTNECKRESKRQRTGRAANEQLAANDIPNVMLKPNSSIIGPLSCTPNPSRIFTSIVNGAPSRRCVLIGVCPNVCVCVCHSLKLHHHIEREPTIAVRWTSVVSELQRRWCCCANRQSTNQGVRTSKHSE